MRIPIFRQLDRLGVAGQPVFLTLIEKLMNGPKVVKKAPAVKKSKKTSPKKLDV
jgi:hypothetical protein